jgi:hypothetical protein
LYILTGSLNEKIMHFFIKIRTRAGSRQLTGETKGAQKNNYATDAGICKQLPENKESILKHANG